jgi:hypothetical protein
MLRDDLVYAENKILTVNHTEELIKEKELLIEEKKKLIEELIELLKGE